MRPYFCTDRCFLESKSLQISIAMLASRNPLDPGVSSWTPCHCWKRGKSWAARPVRSKSDSRFRADSALQIAVESWRAGKSERYRRIHYACGRNVEEVLVLFAPAWNKLIPSMQTSFRTCFPLVWTLNVFKWLPLRPPKAGHDVLPQLIISLLVSSRAISQPAPQAAWDSRNMPFANGSLHSWSEHWNVSS